MPARKPKIELYWSTEKKTKDEIAAEKAAAPGQAVSRTRDVINWRLKGANGEVMCQCTQGFTSRQDARRSIERCAFWLLNVDFVKGAAWFDDEDPLNGPATKVVGPGRKPQPGATVKP